jgi:outer membrane protein assembly factor BamB
VTVKPAFASPVLVDGKVYAATDGGEVFVFEAKPEFKLLAKNVLPEGVKATPAVSQGRILVRGEKTLFCVGKAK